MKCIKRFATLSTAVVLGATVLAAAGGTYTPPTPAQVVAARVARLTVLLTLTTAQQTTATTIFTTEQTTLASIDTQEQTLQTDLATQVKANNTTLITSDASKLGALEGQEILATATADAQFRAMLTTTQQATYDNLKMGGLDGPDGPGGH